MSDDINSIEKWEASYRDGADGWDLGGPTPVFRRLLDSGQFRPGRVLVPCAGRGHDARELARHGFEVTAVDFAPSAVSEMQRLSEPNAPVEILQHDLFTLPHDLNGSFDYIWAYTCLSSLDPLRRDEYADVMTRLLRPGGLYITLAFPLDERTGGPPYALSESELLGLFRERGFVLLARQMPDDSVPERRGAEELFVLQKIL